MSVRQSCCQKGDLLVQTHYVFEVVSSINVCGQSFCCDVSFVSLYTSSRGDTKLKINGRVLMSIKAPKLASRRTYEVVNLYKPFIQVKIVGPVR